MTIAAPPKNFRKSVTNQRTDEVIREKSVVSSRTKVDLNSKAFRDFIKKAPTGMEKDLVSRWKMRGRKVMITIQIDPEMLEQFDELCESLGQSRSALVRTFIGQALEKTSGKP